MSFYAIAVLLGLVAGFLVARKLKSFGKYDSNDAIDNKRYNFELTGLTTN